MDEMDIVLGCSWMESVGTVNINDEKKFLKLWYKKKKITSQDISLSQKQRAQLAHEEVLEGKLIVVPTATLDEESEVESKEKPTKAHEKIPQEGHKNKEESIELHFLKEPQVDESKKENQQLRLLHIATHTTQRNISHKEKVVSANKLTMDPHGTRKALSMIAHGELKAMHGDSKVAQQQHGTKRGT